MMSVATIAPNRPGQKTRNPKPEPGIPEPELSGIEKPVVISGIDSQNPKF
jgi:hypothetical protein